MFRPSDRISVELKRITWMRVFTGSLNNTPLFSSWPATMSLSASCSLKKLQFWPWDPNTSESANLVNNVLANLNTASTQGDAGLKKLIGDVLVKVTDWDPQAIHIGAVPNDWFKWAQSTEQSIDAASSMADILGASSTINGTSTDVNGLKLTPGRYGGTAAYGGGQTLTADQVNIATQIYATVVGQSGLTTVGDQDRAATIALMVAGAESSLSNPSGGDGSSIGPFQQIDTWGSAAQRNNVQWATLAFLKGSQGHPGLFDKNWRAGSDLPSICQSVQGSGTGRASDGWANYGPWMGAAKALVADLRKQLTSKLTSRGGKNTNDGGVFGGTGIPSGSGPTGNYKGTGDQFAKVAYDLITGRPPGSIIYSQERGTHACDPRNDNPTRLDCSSLVAWVYYHTTGQIWAGDNTTTEYPLCIPIPLEMARDIRGALGFRLDPTPSHVGVSLGNGQEAAAHDAYPDKTKDVTIGPFMGDTLNQGALIKDIDYTSAATTQAAADFLTKTLKKKCTISTAKGLPEITDPGTSNGAGSTGSNTTDPFSQLISVYSLAPTPTGDIFGGARLLMNNHPILPWIGNLTNSTMRAFCSAPNGDFIAWFPDYFNVWGTAAIMDIQDIELQNFTVEWSDQQIVTHEFVLGASMPYLDGSSGEISDTGAQDFSTLSAMIATQGIATMDFPEIFKTIYGKSASSTFVTNYLKRFGARPNVESFPNIMRGPQEFYMALWMFMKHWAEQFNATIPMTFMPELWPGMLVRMKQHNFQAYVTEVTHRGSYGPQGQFTTEVKIIAPAPSDTTDRGNLWGVLDVTGGPKNVHNKAAGHGNNRGGRGLNKNGVPGNASLS